MNFNNELDSMCKKIKENIAVYGESFPSACAREGKYSIIENDDWTNGFWTGMLWIAYEHTNDPLFKEYAEKNCDSFRQRLDEMVMLNHHDIGFLYVPSLVASYKITGNEVDREYAIKAADLLLSRYHENGKFIQAWWDLDDDDEYRFIVDSLMNIPLLYWAHNETGEEKYREIADQHVSTVLKYGIRGDYTTHHTFYFDRKTGNPIGGKTAQGVNDDSCWARGQAWVVTGAALNNKYIENENYDEIIKNVYKYFKERVQDDKVPYWDLSFEKGSNEYHDSSAAAIVCCGLHDFILRNPNKEFEQDLIETVESLIKDYSSTNYVRTQGLLEHGMYAHRFCNGVNEPNIWGDYFYMETIFRLNSNKGWRGYW